MVFFVKGWPKLEHIKIKNMHSLNLHLNFREFWCRSIYSSSQVAANDRFGQ